MIKQDGILCQTKKSPLGHFNIKTCGVHPPLANHGSRFKSGTTKIPCHPGRCVTLSFAWALTRASFTTQGFAAKLPAPLWPMPTSDEIAESLKTLPCTSSVLLAVFTAKKLLGWTWILVRCMHLRGGGHCQKKTRVGGVNARHLAGPQLVLVRGQAAGRTAR